MKYERGFIAFNVIAIFLLIGALFVGIYLVANRTSLRSQAGSTPKSNITLESQYITGDKTSASLVNVEVYSSADNRPEKYRLANQLPEQPILSEELQWTEYQYPEWASADQPVTSIWHLIPGHGKRQVLLQFFSHGKWDEKVYISDINLVTASNDLSLSAQCLLEKDATKSKILARWDIESIKKLETDFLWLQLYSSDGTLIADYPNPDLTKPDYTFEVDTPVGNFTLVGIPYLPNDSDNPLDVVKPLGYAEFTTTCDPSTLPKNLTLTFQSDKTMLLKWSGQPGLSAIPIFDIEPGFQIYISPEYQSASPFCGSCEVLFQNVGDVKQFEFDNTLTGFNPRPTSTDQEFTRLTKGKKYALTVTSGGYRLGDKIIFTAK